MKEHPWVVFHETILYVPESYIYSYETQQKKYSYLFSLHIIKDIFITDTSVVSNKCLHTSCWSGVGLNVSC